MSLMGTLAKVAIGYAAARGVDHLSGGQGLGGLMGGAQVGRHGRVLLRGSDIKGDVPLPRGKMRGEAVPFVGFELEEGR